MITTFEIIGMVLLTIVLGISIWWFVIANNYSKYLTNYSYARGANASNINENVDLICGDDKEICVYRAIQICSDPDEKNYENPSTDPIDLGIDENKLYGDFNSSTTVDMTSSIGSECDGKSECSYNFSGVDFPKGMKCNGQTQLISTYSCIPKGGRCQSYS